MLERFGLFGSYRSALLTYIVEDAVSSFFLQQFGQNSTRHDGA
jgi:hypothetical protein